ncbi:MAG: ABC transporter ATP-binding protein [Acidobacteriia bacterium]|nr:ABC transporter ATP-binding protein [Terriglobia bacterium]
MEEEVVGKIYDARLMRRMLRYAWPYRIWFAIALGFLLLNSALQILGPLFTKVAVDRYLAPTSTPASTPIDAYLSSDPWTGLTQISLLYLASMLIGLVCSFSQGYLMLKTGQHAMFDLRRDLMGHLQKLDLAYYDRHPVGRLLTRVTTDVDALNEMLASGLVAVVGDVLVLSFLLIVMFQLSPGMTLLMLAVLPLVVLATALFRKSVQSSYRRIRLAVARINAYMQEHITGITVLQLFNREAKSGQEFDQTNRDHMEAFKDSIFAYGWFYPVVEFLGMLGMASLLVYGGFRIQSGQLTLGVLVAFFQYAMRFYRPIQDLSEKYNIFQAAMAAAERVFQLLDTNVDIAASAQPRTVPAGPVTIEFDRVWFAYKHEDWVLRDVSFRMEPGETIAVVGHTGAGKTTLTSLLLRFYDIQRGAIRIGGIDIREFSPRELRSHFGVVLQDPYLFTGDIGRNIQLGTASIDEEQVRAAAAQVNLLALVDSLPDGLRHPVRERGAGLSTGQKQLVSFARALARNPRFLVLDEATSSVDTETEMRVREALDRLLYGRTSIVIAHRLSTIQRADRILVMHKGELRESGTHQQLLAARGIYFKLYQLQYKDQELAPIGRRPAGGPSQLGIG